MHSLITLTDVGRFSKFFHRHILHEIRNKKPKLHFLSHLINASQKIRHILGTRSPGMVNDNCRNDTVVIRTRVALVTTTRVLLINDASTRRAR